MKKKPRIIITRKKLDTLRDEMAEVLRVGFVRGMTTLRADIHAGDIIKAIKKGTFAQLRIDLDGVVKNVSDPLIARALASTAKATVENMSELPDKFARLGPTNPRVRDYIDSRSKILTDTTHDGLTQALKASGRRNTTITTREKGIGDAVDKLVTRSLNVGMTLPQRAAMIRDSIGLNAPQAQALSNYRNGQLAQGVDGSKLDDRIDAYRNKMLDYRAEMIGRQEVRNAQNASQLMVWQQAVDDEFIPSTSKKVWHCEVKPCPEWCAQMRGVAVALDETWSVKNTKTGQVIEVEIPSDIHTNCECSQSILTDG